MHLTCNLIRKLLKAERYGAWDPPKRVKETSFTTY